MRKLYIALLIMSLLVQPSFAETVPSKRKINRIPILTYHHFSQDPQKWGKITISPKKFREDMLYLKVLNYNTIHFKDLIEYYENDKELPNNPVIINFDDGYQSNYKYAFPILKELNMKGVIYVIGSKTMHENERPSDLYLPYLSWEEMKEMVDSDIIEIQAHSYDLHRPRPRGVSKMSTETYGEYRYRFYADTKKLVDLAKTNLGVELNTYCYPYGIYTKTTESVLKEMGFKVSLLNDYGLGYFSNNLFSLKRFPMLGDITTPRLFYRIRSLEGSRYEIPFYNIESQDDRILMLEKLLKEANKI